MINVRAVVYEGDEAWKYGQVYQGMVHQSMLVQNDSLPHPSSIAAYGGLEMYAPRHLSAYSEALSKAFDIRNSLGDISGRLLEMIIYNVYPKMMDEEKRKNAMSETQRHKYANGENGLNKVHDAIAKRNAKKGVRDATAGNTIHVYCNNSKCSKCKQHVITTKMISREDAEKDLTKGSCHAGFEVRSSDCETLLHTHTEGGNLANALIEFLTEQHNCTTAEMKAHYPSPDTINRRLRTPGGGCVTVKLSDDTKDKHKYWIKKLEPTPVLAIIPFCSGCGRTMKLVNQADKSRSITMEVLCNRWRDR